MDRMRPAYGRQKSNAGTGNTPGAPKSPMMMSPMHHHVRSGSTGYGDNHTRKPHSNNNAAKAAAQRLAQVMSHQSDDDDDDDDDDYDLDDLSVNPTGSIGLGKGTRPMPSRSPMTVRNFQHPPSARAELGAGSVGKSLPDRSNLVARRSSQSIEQIPSARSVSSARSLPINYPKQPASIILGSGSVLSVNNMEQQSLPEHSSLHGRSSLTVNANEQPLSARSAIANRTPQYANSTEQTPSAYSTSTGRSSQTISANEQPLSARSTIANRTPQYPNSTGQTPSTYSTPTGRPGPLKGIKTAQMVPPSVPISLRTTASLPTDIPLSATKRDKRLSLDFGNLNLRETIGSQHSDSALQDELDMLQEENESLLEKIRLVEDRHDEAEARARQLEKQIANLGEGVSLEACLISKKEAALQQREAALKAAAQSYGGRGGEVTALRIEAESARDEVVSTVEQLHEAECELSSLRARTHRMMLSQEEMEDLVLKRCWLSRHWNLCARYGIHGEIAEIRHEYWSSLAPDPLSVVLAAGQGAPMRLNNKLSRDLNIESMLLVEKGIREMIALKVEDAVTFAMAQQRRSNPKDDLKIPLEGHALHEAFELSQEESEDVRFKQAWLTYFWRRAKNHGLEQDIVDERLQFWVEHSGRTSISHDAVEVARGLTELKKLGIEARLWEESRKWLSSQALVNESLVERSYMSHQNTGL